MDIHFERSLVADEAPRLETISPDIFLYAVSFLDAKDLSAVDACSWTTRRQTERAWYELNQREVRATSHAWVDLKESSSRKQQAILQFRAKNFARSVETIHAASTISESEVGDTGECSQTDPLKGEVHAFLEPEAYFFYLTLRHTDPASSETPRTIWEGFVSAVEQGAWEASTILFFHLRELSSTGLCWTQDLRELLDFPHQGGYDGIDQQELHELMKLACDGLTMTLIVFRRENILSKPKLLVSTKGVQSVSRDNRVYFHMTSRLLRPQSLRYDETWVYPRLVTSKKISPDRPGDLLGIRLVCWGIL